MVFQDLFKKSYGSQIIFKNFKAFTTANFISI